MTRNWIQHTTRMDFHRDNDFIVVSFQFDEQFQFIA